MNKKKFYEYLRRKDSGLFGTRLSQKQVDGMENLLNVWLNNYAVDGSADELAYNLATAYHETAHTMQPITERGRRSYFDKYEPNTRIGKVLGNTKKGDGYRYKGEGHVQNTGRRNARHASRQLKKIGINVDLEANPHLRGDPKISAHSLFLGNREGWWTGRKLSHYIDGIDENDDEDFREFVRARAVVNGSDRAKKIAKYAASFRAALAYADYNKRLKANKPPKKEPIKHEHKFPEPNPPTEVVPNPANKPKPTTLWGWFINLLQTIFGRK